MTEEKKDNGSIYIDYESGNVIVAKKKVNDSYSFYATKIGESRKKEDIDFSNLKPIDDIFDYIDKNDLKINVYSKEMQSVKGNKNGK